MKKLIPLLVISFFILPTAALAWDDCPHGLVNDPYPGECNKYVDTDDDGICDRSQPAPEDRVADAEPVEIVVPVKVATDPVQATNTAPEKTIKVETSKNADTETRNKLMATIVTIVISLLAIIGYVQYKKHK